MKKNRRSRSVVRCGGRFRRKMKAINPVYATRPRNRYEVVVGNVGTVYDGKSKRDATSIYRDYCNISDMGRGRAGNEAVTLLHNGEIHSEHGNPSLYDFGVGSDDAGD